jgi:hypothetical protein
MAGVTLQRDYDINRRLANYGIRIEYLERRLLSLEAQAQYTDYTPTLTNIPATITQARWAAARGIVHMWGSLDVTGAVTGVIEIGTPTNIALPGVFRAAGVAFARSAGATGLNVHKGITITRGGGNTVSFLTTDATSALAWNATTPFTWSAGALLTFSAVYERVLPA